MPALSWLLFRALPEPGHSQAPIRRVGDRIRTTGCVEVQGQCAGVPIDRVAAGLWPREGPAHRSELGSVSSINLQRGGSSSKNGCSKGR